jgi:protoheme IX farnesyltransferase
MIKTYYDLTKPGIVYGNALTAIAGFFLASRGHFNIVLFLGMLIGISLIIASACVCNNYFDRDIDHKMVRTKDRALVQGTISGRNAILYALILLVISIITLVLYTNLLTLLISLVGFLVYVFLYTPLKRQSVHATLIGAISGAIPIVTGYCSVTNRFDAGAIILFAILFLWQMPHFYAIAMYRLNDYTNASVPVLPAKIGVHSTKLYIVLYIIAFIAATVLLSLFHYTGYLYLLIMVLLGLTWLGFSIQGFKTGNNHTPWARKMFLFSLVIIMTFSITLSINAYVK